MRPGTRVKIGSELAAFGQSFGRLDFNDTRDQAPIDPAVFEDHPGYECHIRANETQRQFRRTSLVGSADSRDTIPDSDKPFQIAGRH